MLENEKSGIVYVLSNPAMPGIVKIGKTSRNTVDVRLNELYSTGVPVPFECEFAGRVKDESKVEKAFHMAFSPYRLNPKREFFQIEPEQAIALLELMVIDDITPDLQKEADSVDVDSKAASQKLKAQRPRQNFFEMGMEVGSKLTFLQFEAECFVASESKVRFEDELLSLTALTQRLLKKERAVRPAPYWIYEGRRLMEIYNETYRMP